MTQKSADKCGRHQRSGNRHQVVVSNLRPSVQSADRSLSVAERAALDRFAHESGRGWQARLWRCWTYHDWPASVYDRGDEDLLAGLARPSWGAKGLAKYRPPRVTKPRVHRRGRRGRRERQVA